MFDIKKRNELPPYIKFYELLDIAKKFGGPIYNYDSEKIQNQYKKLELAFKTSVQRGL